MSKKDPFVFTNYIFRCKGNFCNNYNMIVADLVSVENQKPMVRFRGLDLKFENSGW